MIKSILNTEWFRFAHYYKYPFSMSFFQYYQCHEERRYEVRTRIADNQSDNIDIMNEKEIHKHGNMLPISIREIICGPSNCGKTNVLISLLEDLHGIFENVYVYSKLLQQPTYRYLENLLALTKEISYFTFSNNNDVILLNEALPNSIFVFDDVACDKQDAIREYFAMGRHADVECFYLCQMYAKILYAIVQIC